MNSESNKVTDDQLRRKLKSAGLPVPAYRRGSNLTLADRRRGGLASAAKRVRDKRGRFTRAC